MQVAIVSKVEDLKTLYDFLCSQGAEDGTQIFVSSDEEGNSYNDGLEIGFDPGVNFECVPYNAPKSRTTGGSVIAYPSGGYADMLYGD